MKWREKLNSIAMYDLLRLMNKNLLRCTFGRCIMTGLGCYSAERCHASEQKCDRCIANFLNEEVKHEVK